MTLYLRNLLRRLTPFKVTFMRNLSKSVLLLAAAAGVSTGCMDAERKLGRGINNMMEPVRMGELRRSVEQTTLNEGPDIGRTVGVIHGVNRTIGRTVVGAFEVVTFPLPSEPYIRPSDPVYPDSFRPKHTSTSSLETDNFIGFDTSGDVFPLSPGSRFHIFD